MLATEKKTDIFKIVVYEATYIFCSLRSKRFRGAQEQKNYRSHRYFHAGKTPKTPFLSLSLLPDPTEKLPTMAISLATAHNPSNLYC